MADNATRRAEHVDLQQDDPFAELTRIMGHDPRQDDHASGEGQDDLSLDLENELLGGLDLSDDKPTFDRDTYEPQPERRQDTDNAWEIDEDAAYEPEFTPEPEAAPVEAAAPSDEFHLEEFDQELESAFDAGLDNELALDDFEAVGEATSAPTQSDSADEVDAADIWPADDQAQDNADLEGTGYARSEPVDGHDSFAEKPETAFDFSEIDKRLDALGRETEAPVQEPAAPADPEPSLEDELAMLLAGDTGPQHAHSAARMSAAEESHSAEIPSAEPYPSDVLPEPDDAGLDPASFRDNSFAPDIETVEMAEFEPPRAEDLGIPDLPVEEPIPAATDLDDLTVELNQAFEFMDGNAAEPAPAEVGGRRAEPGHDRAAAPGEYAFDDLYPATATAAGAAGLAGAGGNGVPADDRYESHAHVDDGAGRGPYGYDHGVTTTMALPEEPHGAAGRFSRRGMVIAAAVVAIALLGGIGVFALSFGGSGGGEPVLLQADADPVRVRPENPGGAVVPNQDNEVYQRAAGGQDEREPSQERLITTTEEPVDLTAQSGPRIIAPGIGDDAGDEAALADDAEMPIATVKAEDRVVPESNEAAQSASDDFIAIQPRRVRTMIVRPDGTIVPREEVEPVTADEGADAATRQVAALPQTPSTLAPVAGGTELSQPDAGASGADQPQQAAASEAPATATGETAAAATSSQQPVASSPPPAPAAPAQQQVAAASPTPPSSAATSDWSMQIASQPSAESAQATYQDLARRYSSLLEGRGVNIVRADIEGRGIYYRVRIPAASRDEAVNLCTQYKAVGGSCFVSR